MSTASKGWDSAHFRDLDAVPIAEGLVWHPVRRRFGIRAFGVNAYTSEGVGKHVVEKHDERSGGAGGPRGALRRRSTAARPSRSAMRRLDAPAGTLLFIADPALERSAIAEQEGTLVLAIGGPAGEAYEVSAWESYFAAIPLFKEERWDEAIDAIAEGLGGAPAIRPFSTTSPARSRGRAAPTTRSST